MRRIFCVVKMALLCSSRRSTSCQNVDIQTAHVGDLHGDVHCCVTIVCKNPLMSSCVVMVLAVGSLSVFSRLAPKIHHPMDITVDNI